MTKVLRVGVIGLGRRWRRRFRPALLRLRGRFEVRAVCDEVRQRALDEAERLGCDAAAGPTQLLEGDDLDAVLLPDPQWYGLWPLEAACRAGKPVLCAVTPDRDEAHADAVLRQVGASGLPVMAGLGLRCAPALARLRDLLATRLGPARAVLCELTLPRRGGGEAAPGLLGGAGVHLLDGCAGLLGGEPSAVLAARSADGSASTVFLEFGDGRAAQVTCLRAPGAGRALRLRVAAERGPALLEMPGRLHWTDADGRHTLAPRRSAPLGRVLLRRFHRAVTQERAPEPALADAYRALGWLRAAVRSAAEGRRVPLNG